MDAQVARSSLENMVRGATDYAHVLVGVKAGLIDVLAQASTAGMAPDALAAELGYRADYVRIWCQTAYAIGVLEDAGGGQFRLADGFAQLLPAAAEGSLAPILRMHEPFIAERLELAELLRSGEERPRTADTFDPEQARRFLPRARHQGRVRTERIYEQLPEVAARLARGARVLEVGCGSGMQMEALAAALPRATFVGIDVLAGPLEVGAEAVRQGPYADRIAFRHLAAEALVEEAAFDLVLLNIVLHELRPEIRPAAVERMVAALRPGGLFISNDFAYPNTLAEFRDPRFALGVFDQAQETAWGSRHLTQDELTTLFITHGFARCTFQLIEDLPFPSVVRSGAPVVNLTTLAFK